MANRLQLLPFFISLLIIVTASGWIVAVTWLPVEGLTAGSTPSLLENPCPNGEFLDLTADVCRPLAKEWGFDVAEFDSAFSGNEYPLTTCTQDGLNDVLLRAKPTGGTILLPRCTIPISSSITIPSNTIFQGAGRDETLFQAQPGFSGNMLRSKHDANIIIRDLTVDGANTDSTGILVWYVRNVLIERVHVHHNQGSGITFRYAHKVTVRYNESHDHTKYHGVGSKDCFPKHEDIPDLSECQTKASDMADAGDMAPGTLWTRDYAVYSNHLYNNGDHGIDLHALQGEVAGNISQNNAYGSKFPDASHLWIHHNHFNNNSRWGLYMYNTLDTGARIAGNSIIYSNQFIGNSAYPLRVNSPARNVLVVSNVYEDNQPNRLRIVDASVFICPESAESLIEVDGDPPQIANAEQCDLSNVSTLFPLTKVYLPLF